MGIRRSKVILPCTRFFEEEKCEDNNYVAIAHRAYRWDNTDHWGRLAIEELDIPYIVSHQHEKFFDDSKNFKKLLTDCSFIISTKLEASTGGMSLLEAYNCGKPVLISDSQLNGANDIFGARAYKYKYGSFDHLNAFVISLIIFSASGFVFLVARLLVKYLVA